MDLDPIAAHTADDFDQAWEKHRHYVLGLASRMLGDPAAAEDIVQEAFSRLAQVGLDEIDDVRGWLVVVVRRLCLDRIRSAPARRESTAATVPDGQRDGVGGADPIDRVTLDDQVQLALSVVLDRLTPAERTAFVLHDVFGFSFAEIAEIVGRTTAACRQLASRARRSVRSGAPRVQPDAAAPEARVVERFIAACAGGDIGALMAVLDPDIEGSGTLLGRGPLESATGRPAIAQRMLGLFGPGTDRVLVPMAVERELGLVAFDHGRVAAVITLEAAGDRVRHITAFVRPPHRRDPS